MRVNYIKPKHPLPPDAPKVMNVKGPELVRNGDVVEFVCDFIGYPLSTITWTYRRCKVELMLVSPDCEIKGHPIEV